MNSVNQVALMHMRPSLQRVFFFFPFWLDLSSLIAKVEEHEVRKVEKSMIRKHLTQFVMKSYLLVLGD